MKPQRGLSQFFEGEDGLLSMTRLLCFLSFWPASFVVLVTKSADTLGWYLGAYTGAYIGGKGADVWKKRGERDADTSDK